MTNEAILARFIATYPEFASVLQTQEQTEHFYAIVAKVSCLYPEFSDLSLCINSYPFLMLVAHYFVMGGFSASIGITAQSGLVASSSVGDVSVSYQGNPSAKDEFGYFLAQTKYGAEYLAWLKRQSGLIIVN